MLRLLTQTKKFKMETNYPEQVKKSNEFVFTMLFGVIFFLNDYF